MIESFLTNHKRGCLANKGENCTCGLFEARAELACLLTRQARLLSIEKAAQEVDWDSVAYMVSQPGLYIANDRAAMLIRKLAAALKQEQEYEPTL